jgi:hypothetical protein
MTAVEWLEQQLLELNHLTLNEIIKKAKEMEKEQQDEFAIGFARFYYVEKIGETKETYQSAEKILELYKKEKGL